MSINYIVRRGGEEIMHNSIFSKLSLRTSNQYYSPASTSFKIKGKLLEKKGASIKLQIGEDKIIEAHLKEEIKGGIGDFITIDKKNIIKSKLHTEKELVQEKFQGGEEDQVLKKLEIPSNDETKEALRVLEKHGVEVSKENIQNFILAKTSLEKVVEGINYDTTLKLMERNIDIKEEAIQNVAHGIEEIKKEDQGFPLLKFLTGKKEMTIEDAEKIAHRLYGNRMGKDITDAIRALYKSGMEITKKNIEKINAILNKLHSLQTMDEEIIVDSIKNKIDATIDNLYKLKNAIDRSVIESRGSLSIAAMRAYETVAIKPSVSDRDLRLMEEDIKDTLNRFQIKVNKDSMQRAKALIKKGLEVSKGNMERVEDIKLSLHHLNRDLNHQKTVLLLRNHKAVLKTDVVKLSRTVVSMVMEDESISLQQEEGPTVVEERIRPIETIIKSLQTLGTKKDSIVSLLLKTARPVNLQEIYHTSLFVKNESQIGDEINGLLNILDKSEDETLKRLEIQIREFLQQETKEMKQGSMKVERVYQHLGKWMGEIENNLSSLAPATRDIIQKTSHRLMDSLELQMALNQEDTVLQVPIVMENNIKNLQIYIMNRKRSSRKIDPSNMSVLLNFDTNNMGNINIYTAVNHKHIVMKIGLKNEADRHLFIANKKTIEELLGILGYQLKELSFKIDEEPHLLSMMEEVPKEMKPNHSYLDVKI